MGPLEGLAYGFSVALLPSNLFACFVGVLVGTIVGVLPGTVGVVGIMLAAGWLADVAVRFGPPEYFAITLGGILLLSRLSGGSILNAFVMVALGLALGTVGMDSISALRRFTFGSVQLAQGIELVPVIMGVYGVAEVLLLAEEGIAKTQIAKVKLRELLPTPEEWRRSTMPLARGSIVGFLTGLVPGPAAVLSTFISYTVEKKMSKTPEKFGTGMIEGVAGPESANNGATAGAMVPLLSLGIPFSPATAILLGALVIHGLQPGPLMISQRPEIFWGFVASMYIGNFLLLILNLPLVGLFVSVLRLPQHVLATLVLLLMMEKTLRQSLFLTRGSIVELVSRPLTAVILISAAAALVGPSLVRLLRRRARPAEAPA